MDIYAKFKVDTVFRFVSLGSDYHNKLFIVDVRLGRKVLIVLDTGKVWSTSRLCLPDNIDKFHKVKVTVVKGD